MATKPSPPLLTTALTTAILLASGVLALFYFASEDQRSAGSPQPRSSGSTAQESKVAKLTQAASSRLPIDSRNPKTDDAPVADATALEVSTLFDMEDPAGVTPRQRLECIVNSYDHMLAMSSLDGDRSSRGVEAQRMFLYRAVGTLLHAQGRVGFPRLLTAEETKLYKPNLPSDYPDPDRFTFSADGAWYVFYRGEFPEFDMAYAALGEGPGVLDPSKGGPYERIYRQALATFNTDGLVEGEKK